MNSVIWEGNIGTSFYRMVHQVGPNKSIFVLERKLTPDAMGIERWDRDTDSQKMITALEKIIRRYQKLETPSTGETNEVF